MYRDPATPQWPNRRLLLTWFAWGRWYRQYVFYGNMRTRYPPTNRMLWNFWRDPFDYPQPYKDLVLRNRMPRRASRRLSKALRYPRRVRVALETQIGLESLLRRL